MKMVGIALGFIVSVCLLLMLWQYHGNSVRQEALTNAERELSRGAAKDAVARLSRFVGRNAKEDDPLWRTWRQARRAWSSQLIREKQFDSARKALRSEQAITDPRHADYRALIEEGWVIDRAEAAELAATGQTDLAVRMFVKLNSPKQAVDALVGARRFAAAAQMAGTKLGDTQLTRSLWGQAGELAATSGEWFPAAQHFERAERWEDAAEALIKAGKPAEARSFAARKIKDPAVRAKISAAAGEWGGAAALYAQAGLVDMAADAYMQIKAWREIGSLYGDQPARAADYLERAMEWQMAAEAWQQAKNPERAAVAYERGELWSKAGSAWEEARAGDRAQAAFRRAINERISAGDFAEASLIPKLLRDPAIRQAVLDSGRGSFDPDKHAIELAAFLANGEAWTEAAQIYERLGVYLPAADAWQQAGNLPAVAKALMRAAQTELDVELTLRAAEACHAANDAVGRSEMQNIALQQALAQERPTLIAEVYRKSGRENEGAAKLLAIGESWVDRRDQEALEALLAAESLLPRTTFVLEIKALYKRAEALGQKLRVLLRRYTKIDEGRTNYTNYFGATGRFEYSQGNITVTNFTGRHIKRMVLVMEFFGKAPDVYFTGAKGGIHTSEMRRSIDGWLWRDRGMLDDFAKSKGEFIARETVLNLVPGESRTISVKFENRVPYKKARMRFTEIEGMD